MYTNDLDFSSVQFDIILAVQKPITVINKSYQSSIFEIVSKSGKKMLTIFFHKVVFNVNNKVVGEIFQILPSF